MMISIVVGSILFVSVLILAYSVFFVLSKITWCSLTSNEKSQIVSIFFPIGLFSFLAKKFLLDFIPVDFMFCYVFSCLFCVVGGVSVLQKKYSHNNRSRWQLLFQDLDAYFSLFFFAAAFIFLFCGLVIQLKS